VKFQGVRGRLLPYADEEKDGLNESPFLLVRENVHAKASGKIRLNAGADANEIERANARQHAPANA
jgi:hypothetical protein